MSRSNVRAYIRIVKNRCLFDSLEKNNDRSCNCYAQLGDGIFLKCFAFTIDELNHYKGTLYYIIETKQRKFCNIIEEVTRISNEITFVPTACAFLWT